MTCPYTVAKIFPHSAVELEVDVTGHRFNVNGYRVKLYHGEPIEPPRECDLAKPVITDAQVLQALVQPGAQPGDFVQLDTQADLVVHEEDSACHDVFAILDV